MPVIERPFARRSLTIPHVVTPCRTRPIPRFAKTEKMENASMNILASSTVLYPRPLMIFVVGA